jgi:actin-related protein 3
MGYAGNAEPSYIIPSTIAVAGSDSSTVRSRQGIDDLDFYIGNEAFNHSSSHQLNYPISQGIIQNWDNMEKLWQRCLFQYLRCEPEEHYMLLVSILS